MRRNQPSNPQSSITSDVYTLVLRSVGNSFVVTIPAEIVRGNGWKAGEELRLSENHGIVSICTPEDFDE